MVVPQLLDHRLPSGGELDVLLASGKRQFAAAPLCRDCFSPRRYLPVRQGEKKAAKECSFPPELPLRVHQSRDAGE